MPAIEEAFAAVLNRKPGIEGDEYFYSWVLSLLCELLNTYLIYIVKYFKAFNIGVSDIHRVRNSISKNDYG